MATNKPKNQSSLRASAGPVSAVVGADGAKHSYFACSAVVGGDDQSFSTLGRDRHVRDATAQIFNQSASVSIHTSASFPPSPPISPSSSPKVVSPIKSALKSPKSTSIIKVLGAPLTPQSSTDSLPLSVSSLPASLHAPTFLDAIFPLGCLSGLAVHTVEDLPRPGLKAAVVDRYTTSGLRTLYISGLTAIAPEDLRDTVVEVLDLADERVEADEVVWVLEKKAGGLRELLQGLLYVGGTVVKGGIGGEKASNDIVLVGIEI